MRIEEKCMELSGTHKKLLFEESAITPEVVESRGYRTMINPEELLGLGFESYQTLTPGLLIPLHDMFGSVSSYQYRPDNPRKNAEGKLVKYETREGYRQVLDANPILGERMRDPKVPLIVTEGARKADAAISEGYVAVALPGVWCWRKDGVPLPEWEDIKLYGREVYVAFDSDAQTNPHVLKALVGLCEFLRSRGANA
jgi:putative DNA primase/helicase